MVLGIYIKIWYKIIENMIIYKVLFSHNYFIKWKMKEIYRYFQMIITKI